MGQIISELRNSSCCAAGNNDSQTESFGGEDFIAPSNSYVVTLDRNSGKKLGLDVEPKQTGKILPIIGISGGLAEEWNNSHPPAQQVSGGCQILDVNGAHGDIKKMMERCKADKILRMTVIPAPSTSSASVASVSAAPYENPIVEPYSNGDDNSYQAFDVPEPSPAPSGPGRDDGVRRLVAMGIAHDKATQAMDIAYDDFDTALSVVANVTGDAVQGLVGMGFTLEKSQEALVRSNGNADEALSRLTVPDEAEFSPAHGGGGAADNEALATLTAMGFGQEQASAALVSANGDVNQAIAFLSSDDVGGQSPAGQGRGGGGGGGGGDNHDAQAVQQIKDMGFTDQQARDALDGAGGNVDRAIGILVG